MSLSPDGGLGFLAERRLVVVSGPAGAEYSGVADMIFGPDGKRVVYVPNEAAGKGSPIFSPDGDLEYLAAREGDLYRIRYTPAR